MWREQWSSLAIWRMLLWSMKYARRMRSRISTEIISSSAMLMLGQYWADYLSNSIAVNASSGSVFDDHFPADWRSISLSQTGRSD